MERKIIECINEYVNYLEYIQNCQRSRADDLKGYDNLVIENKTIASGRKYYYCKKPGESRYRYLGKDGCEDVLLIKEARYYKESLSLIQTNLDVCKKLLDKFRLTDYDSINEHLPLSYKDPVMLLPHTHKNTRGTRWKEEREAYKESCGPWYPEDLKDRTTDGSMVRSKSEALIYNQYYNYDATFVYELPIRLRTGQVRHPDFSILSELDWTTVILHDHQGMYGMPDKRRKYEEDMCLYWQNGFIPGVNIFYTFDDPRGGFDISPVHDIMKTKIRPQHL